MPNEPDDWLLGFAGRVPITGAAGGVVSTVQVMPLSTLSVNVLSARVLRWRATTEWSPSESPLSASVRGPGAVPVTGQGTCQPDPSTLHSSE